MSTKTLHFSKNPPDAQFDAWDRVSGKSAQAGDWTWGNRLKTPDNLADSWHSPFSKPMSAQDPLCSKKSSFVLAEKWTHEIVQPASGSLERALNTTLVPDGSVPESGSKASSQSNSAKVSQAPGKPVTTPLGNREAAAGEVAGQTAVETWNLSSTDAKSQASTGAWDRVYSHSPFSVVNQELREPPVQWTPDEGPKPSSSQTSNDKSRRGCSAHEAALQGGWDIAPPQQAPQSGHGKSPHVFVPHYGWMPPPPPPESNFVHETGRQSVSVQAPTLPFDDESAHTYLCHQNMPPRSRNSSQAAASLGKSDLDASPSQFPVLQLDDGLKHTFLYRQNMRSRSGNTSQAGTLTDLHAASPAAASEERKPSLFERPMQGVQEAVQNLGRLSPYDLEIQLHRSTAPQALRTELSMDERIAAALQQIALQSSTYSEVHRQESVDDMYDTTPCLQQVTPEQLWKRRAAMPLASIETTSHASSRLPPSRPWQEAGRTRYARPGDITPHPLSSVASEYPIQPPHPGYPRVRTVSSASVKQGTASAESVRLPSPGSLYLDSTHSSHIHDPFAESVATSSSRGDVEGTTFARLGAISPHPLESIRSNMSFIDPPKSEPAWGTDDIPFFSDTHSSHYTGMFSHESPTVETNTPWDEPENITTTMRTSSTSPRAWREGSASVNTGYNPPTVESAAPTPTLLPYEPDSYPFRFDGTRSASISSAPRDRPHQSSRLRADQPFQRQETRYFDCKQSRERVKPSPLVPHGRFPEYEDPCSTNTDHVRHQTRPRDRSTRSQRAPR